MSIKANEPAPFCPHSDPASVSTRWRRWVKNFERYVVAMGITCDLRKKALLLNLAGTDVSDIFDNSANPGTTYDEAKKVLDKVLDPMTNTFVDTFKFRKAKQELSESFLEFYTRLRSLASTCEFDTRLDFELIMQILVGTKSESLQKKILGTVNITLDQVLEFGQTEEAASSHTVDLKKNAQPGVDEHAYCPRNMYDNHLGLPEEMFDIILQHLDLEDVLSCSLVCLGWRNAVNSDRIWEKLCKKNISEERLKLRADRKRVGSSHEAFETENLPMLCVWRRRYMDDVDLKRNWKRGCCQEEFISNHSSHFDDVETDNELLLVPNWSGSLHYTVFNIVDNPIMTGEIHLALRDHTPELVKSSNNILVIVQRTLLQVYVKNEDKKLKLKFLALFDRDHSETIPDTPDLTNWYEQIAPGYLNYCDHNGKHFVGITSRYVWSPLHIWDLESQTKIQEVAVPMQMPGEQLEWASFFLRDDTIFITLTYPSSALIRSYDIEKSSYSETVLELEGRLRSRLFTGTVAIMESHLERKWLLFDLRDGRMLDTLTNGQGCVGSVHAFGNLIAYELDEYDEHPPTVTVYDMEKLCLVDKFPVERRYGLVHRTHIVMDNIMLICTDRQLLILDMKTREILRTVECSDFLPSDPSCSKMLVEKPGNKLVLLQFW